ncbi:uncharacterized protein PHACADRAFT_87954, partial [Phanerochaete carnosa HHB-10118-sp]
FVTRANRFMDAYRRGLTGKQAAWACKKYRGHRVLPDTIHQQNRQLLAAVLGLTRVS